MVSTSIHFCLLSKKSVEETCQKSRTVYPKVKLELREIQSGFTILVEGKSLQEVDDSKRLFQEAFASYEIPNAEGDIALALQQALIQRKETIAFAESCTGGMLSHLLTSNPGASNCFLGSFVTYSNQLKEKILHVGESTLKQYGAVSSQTVKEMVEGTVEQTGADYAISVSGVASPVEEGIPTGTVWFACMKKGHLPEMRLLNLSGNRVEIILKASNQILSFAFRRVLHGISILDPIN